MLTICSPFVSSSLVVVKTMEASPASPVKDSILGSRLSSILTELQSRQLQQDAPKPHSAEIIKKEISAEVAVLLMGVTGSGKSSFIRRVTQNEDVRVGNSLQSSTSLSSVTILCHSRTY